MPASSMLALPLGTGHTGVTLDLRHASRSTARVLDELLGLLLGICRMTPQVWFWHCVLYPLIVKLQRLPDQP